MDQILIVVPLITITVSFFLLTFFGSREEKELELINYQWKDITLWMLIMLFFIGLLFASVTLSMVAGLKNLRLVTEYLLNTSILAAVLIMFYRLVYKMKLGPFTLAPTKEMGMYIASVLLSYRWFWIVTGGTILAAAAGIIIIS